MSKMVQATINGQFKIKLPDHRADRPDWYTEEGWEKKRLMKMYKEIDKGDVVYYAGVEEGEMAALCQIWGAEVFMFEPNPLVWPNIKAIWKANKLKDPIGMFVGFASAGVDESPTNPNPLAEGFVMNGWPKSADGEVIGDHGFKELYLESDAFPQITIDECVKRTGVIPTIITFDCEGSDWMVLKGAQQTLREHKPKIFASIHPEFMFHQFEQYQQDFRNWIKDLGYKEEILDYQHELHTYYEVI